LAACKDARNAEVEKNIQTAAAFHEGLRAYGIGYVLSPNRPFAQASVDKAAVDSLKFPRQTLGYRSGDCADLSVLYASFFEAAGIETAFVTVPGHIFMAFDSGLSMDEARARALDERELIDRGGKAWVPVETTMRDTGFLEVWRKAASEWRAASAKGMAAFYPMHESWKSYAPVGLPADGSSVVAPPADRTRAAFSAELAKLVKLEVESRIARVGVGQGQDTAKSRNERGVLYAKYGMYTEAERELKAAAKDGSASALVNLGNIAFMKSDLAGAYSYYLQADKKSPNNAKLLINVARAASAMGKADEAAQALDKAKALDPAQAERFASAAQASPSAGRAAEVDASDILWL